MVENCAVRGRNTSYVRTSVTLYFLVVVEVVDDYGLYTKEKFYVLFIYVSVTCQREKYFDPRGWMELRTYIEVR